MCLKVLILNKCSFNHDMVVNTKNLIFKLYLHDSMYNTSYIYVPIGIFHFFI